MTELALAAIVAAELAAAYRIYSIVRAVWNGAGK